MMFSMYLLSKEVELKCMGMQYTIKAREEIVDWEGFKWRLLEMYFLDNASLVRRLSSYY